MKDLKLSLIVQAVDKATSIVGKVGGAIKGLEGRVHRFNSVFRKIGVGEVLGGAALIGGATLAAKSILDLTNKTAEFGVEILHAAEKAGVSVPVFQRLAFAAKQFGVEREDIGRGIFLMQRATVDALTGKKEPQRAFRALHISLPELKGLTKNPEAELERIQDAFSKIVNPAVRAKLAMDLFSRAGIRMIPFLMGGSAETKRLEAQLEALHGVISQEDAEAADRYVRAKNLMGAAVAALEMRIGNKLIPTMTTAIEKVTAWIANMSPTALKAFTKSINDLVKQLPDMTKGFANVLKLIFGVAGWLLKFASNATVLKVALYGLAGLMAAQLLVAIVSVTAALFGMVVAAVPVVMAMLPIILIATAIGAVAWLIISHWKELGPFFSNLWDAIGQSVSEAWGHIVDGATGAVAWVKGLWLGVVGFFRGLWDKVGQIFSTAVKWIETNTPIGWLYDRWNGIVPYFNGLFGKVENIFSGAWKRIAAATPDWLKTILKVGAVAGFAANPGLALAAGASLVPHGGRLVAAVAGPGRAIHRPTAEAAGSKSQVTGTITVQARPGTAVTKMTSSGGVDLRHQRGVFPG